MEERVEELRTALREKLAQYDDVSGLLAAWDEDGSGTLSPTEFYHACLLLGLDVNGDGSVDLFVVNIVATNELLLGDGAGGFAAAGLLRVWVAAAAGAGALLRAALLLAAALFAALSAASAASPLDSSVICSVVSLCLPEVWSCNPYGLETAYFCFFARAR